MQRLPQPNQRSQHAHHSDPRGSSAWLVQVVAGDYDVQDVPEELDRFAPHFPASLVLALLTLLTLLLILTLQGTLLYEEYHFNEALECSKDILEEVHLHALDLENSHMSFRNHSNLTKHHVMIEQVKQDSAYTFQES